VKERLRTTTMLDHLPPSTQPFATMLDEAELSGSASRRIPSWY